MSNARTDSEEVADIDDERNRVAAEQEKTDLTWIMEHEQGRRFIWSRLEKLRLFEISFSGNNSEMIFKEGIRQAGLQLHMDLQEAAPDELLKMMLEAREEELRLANLDDK